MSYSFGFQVEDTKHGTIFDATQEAFEKAYTEPASEVSSAITRLRDELPYFAQQFASDGEESGEMPEGTILNITVSGHEKVDDNDQAPRYQSVTLTLNPKPEPAQAEATDEATADNADEAEEPELAAVGAGGKAKSKAKK